MRIQNNGWNAEGNGYLNLSEFKVFGAVETSIGNVRLDNTTWNNASSTTVLGSTTLFGDRSIPVDPEGTYAIQFNASSDTTGARHYAGYATLDADSNSIDLLHYFQSEGSFDSTLVAALLPGSTQMTVADATSWYEGPISYRRSFIWMDYQDSTGLSHGTEYSRNLVSYAWPEQGIQGNTINLTLPWAGPTLPAGTRIRNTTSGASFQYNVLADQPLTNMTKSYSGTINGTNQSSTVYYDQFRPGTSFIKPVILANYAQGSSNSSTWSNFVVDATNNVLSASENTPVGSIVGRLLASGAGVLSYKLIESSGPFSIDPLSGDLTINNSSQLDFETQAIHFIRVQVTSSNGRVASKDYRIKLKDVNEAIEFMDVTFAPNLNSASVGAVLGTASVRDPDAHDTLTYSIVSNPQNLFAINAHTGTIILANSVGSTSVEPIMVRAVDHAGHSIEIASRIPIGNTILVTSDLDFTNESDGVTTLREAVTFANNTPGPDLIVFDLPLNKRELSIFENQSIHITSEIEIQGPDDGTTITLTRSSTSNPLVRYFDIQTGASVKMSSFMMLDGRPVTGNGGAILNSGTLTLDRITIANSNVINGSGGGIYNASGASLTISNSTISTNSASGSGGGIQSLGLAILTNVTIADNTSSSGTGGIASGSSTIVRNSIIARNIGASDVVGAFASNQHNIVGVVGFATGFSPNELFGQSNINLGSLQDNGGPSWTHQLLVGSPAIDAGDNTVASLMDQRWAGRLLDGPDPGNPQDRIKTVDIGSFEFGTLFVNTVEDILNLDLQPNGLVDVSPAVGSQVSVRSAIQEFGVLAGIATPHSEFNTAFDAVVAFNPQVDLAKLYLPGADEDASNSGDLDIFGSITVRGGSNGVANQALTTAITGGWYAYTGGLPLDVNGPPLNDRLFHVLPAANLRLEKVKLEGGKSVDTHTEFAGYGGVVLNENGFLNVQDSSFGRLQNDNYFGNRSNTAEKRGGAIYQVAGTTTIANSLIAGKWGK